MMRVAVYRRAGKASDVLSVDNVPRPGAPSRGEVLVRVVASSVNVLDVKLRSQELSRITRPLPKTPGIDIGGVVSSAPRTSKFKRGDRVFAMLQKVFTGKGGTAEYALIPEQHCAHAPSSCSLVGAASLPLVGLTILQGVDKAVKHSHWSTAENNTALVQAGSGGLGTFAVQYLAHHLGMDVATTCSSERTEYMKGLGASRVIDYRNQDFTKECTSTYLIVDPLAYMLERQTWSSTLLIARGGHYVSIAASSWEPSNSERDPLGFAVPEARMDWVIAEMMRAQFRNLFGHANHHGPVFVEADRQRLERVQKLVDEGKVLPQVEKVYSMDEIADAHAHVESGRTQGKVVVQVADEATVVHEEQP